MPRDLAHFVLEAALGLERGFWGCVADGVVFPNMRHQQSAAARQVLRACAEALAVAEAQVNAIHFAWRRGERPIHAEQLDAMLLRWEALDDGASLLLEWPLATARDRRQPPR
ncbi:MAG TPA: hypothetical protein ENK18_24950 [Deltaproteobacteria bacterium]|nr:hypothetical protein [Deltaproteobacteria bacterium]